MSIVGVVSIYQREHFKTGTEIGTLLVIFTFFGWSMIPMIYVFSYLFKKPETGEGMTSLLFFVCKLKKIEKNWFDFVEAKDF
jgi:hypothetical protein